MPRKILHARKFHRVLGLILLLPFFGWALTGLIFFLKPGYKDAYEMLALKTYPLEQKLTLAPDPAWLEIRYLRTVLGEHLLVRTKTGWSQLDPNTMQPQAPPDTAKIKLLLQDACAAHPQRYGNIVSVENNTAKTDTGVEITLDWNRLSLQQKGKDTDRIDLLYRIHYLQWTSISSIDKPLGFIGIVLVMILTMLGIRLALQRSTSN